jgi:hypothetical protein
MKSGIPDYSELSSSSERIHPDPASPRFWRALDPRAKHKASRSYGRVDRVPSPRDHTAEILGHLAKELPSTSGNP